MPHTTSIFGAFTTPQRLVIAKALLPGPIHCAAISEITDYEQALVSQTLMKFRALDLVEFKQEGTRRYYQFKTPDKVQQLLTLAESLTKNI